MTKIVLEWSGSATRTLRVEGPWVYMDTFKCIVFSCNTDISETSDLYFWKSRIPRWTKALWICSWSPCVPLWPTEAWTLQDLWRCPVVSGTEMLAADPVSCVAVDCACSSRTWDLIWRPGQQTFSELFLPCDGPHYRSGRGHCDRGIPLPWRGGPQQCWDSSDQVTFFHSSKVQFWRSRSPCRRFGHWTGVSVGYLICGYAAGCDALCVVTHSFCNHHYIFYHSSPFVGWDRMG